MSSKEAILSRLRGAATPMAHAPHGWQPWRGENEQARRFYTRNGFHEGEQRICEHSGHAEIIMHWQRGI